MEYAIRNKETGDMNNEIFSDKWRPKIERLD